MWSYYEGKRLVRVMWSQSQPTRFAPSESDWRYARASSMACDEGGRKVWDGTVMWYGIWDNRNARGYQMGVVTGRGIESGDRVKCGRCPIT